MGINLLKNAPAVRVECEVGHTVDVALPYYSASAEALSVCSICGFKIVSFTAGGCLAKTQIEGS